MKKTASAITLTLLLTSMLTLAFSSSISLVRALWVWELPIPYVTRASEVTVDGEIAEEGWNYATHFHNYSTHKKTIEFDVFLMHDGMSLYMASKIYSNDFWGSGWLSDSFEVEINDRNDGHYGGDSGNDVKRIMVTPTGLGIYKDKWIPSDERQDTKVDGEGAFTFSGIRQDGEIGDYYFELRIPIDGDPPEDAKLREGTPFGMMISFIDYDPAENVGFGYWLLQGSFVLEAGPPTVYIRADGSIDPPDAPISTVDYVTYTLTGNITSDADGVVVERSNIIIDGADYTVEGSRTYPYIGIYLSGVNNATIKNVNVTYFHYGIYLNYSFNNNISGDSITNNGIAIYLHSSSDNNIVGNSITANNWYGILLGYSSNNRIYHNNFEDNHPQVYGEYSTNVWDDGYPSGGNYWSDYAGVDEKSGLNQDQSGRDGIGDAPYFISEHPYTTRDRYPLRSPFSTFHAGTWNGTAYDVDVVSNSTVSDFHFNPYEGAFLEFKVTGEAGTRGFCRVTIPRGLLWTEDGWVVLVDGEPVDYSQIQDENFTYLYFTYIHSTHEIQIIGTHVIVPPPLTYSLTITTTVGGTTDPAPGTYSYTANSTVQVTAIPNAGYLFDYWDLDGVNVGSANPYTVLMNKNHTLKAIFSHIKPAVPVGGYSIPIQVQTKTEPIIPYIALIATLTAILTKLKPKTKRKH